MASTTAELTVSYASLLTDGGHEARRVLRREGVVFVSGVLNARECEKTESGLGQFARESSSHRGGIVCADGAAHLQPMWELRMHEGVQRTFASVLKCGVDELVCSLDRFNWNNGRASGASSASYRSPRGWDDLDLHLDLNPFSLDGQSDEEFIQGVITLSAGGGGWSGGTTVVPRSQLLFHELDRSCFSSMRGDFCVLNQKGIDFRQGARPASHPPGGPSRLHRNLAFAAGALRA